MRRLARWLVLSAVVGSVCACSTGPRRRTFNIPQSIRPSGAYTASVWGGTTYVVEIECQSEEGSVARLKIFMKCSAAGEDQSFKSVSLLYGGELQKVESARDFKRLEALLMDLAKAKEASRREQQESDMLDSLSAALTNRRDVAVAVACAAGESDISAVARARLGAQAELVDAVLKTYRERAGRLSVPGAAERMLSLLKQRPPRP